MTTPRIKIKSGNCIIFPNGSLIAVAIGLMTEKIVITAPIIKPVLSLEDDICTTEKYTIEKILLKIPYASQHTMQIIAETNERVSKELIPTTAKQTACKERQAGQTIAESILSLILEKIKAPIIPPTV